MIPPGRAGASIGALQAEVRNVIQGFAGQRKVYERDLAVLDHTRKAVAALSNERERSDVLEKTFWGPDLRFSV